LDSEGIKPLAPNCPERALGTEDFVFLYAGPFCFPHTGCGLLFSHRLEEEHREEGAATAFDSGGLMNHFARPDPSENPAAFLARHDWPLPEHRDYLERALGVLFADPVDYLRGVSPRWPGPIGLTGGDRRRWTHEVRVPRQVFVKTGHLRAVFAPLSRAADPEIRALRRWCKQQGVDYVKFHASHEDDFETLRRECVDYITAQLL
jgi:hypothetical protein